jgi:predicted transposase YdaD
MLFGTSKTITERMFQGSEYSNVKKVYSINIVYFDLGEGDVYFYHGKTHFVGLHKHDELRLSKSQRKEFDKEFASDIYPEYYILKVNNFDDHTRDRLDEWIYFLKHNTIKDEFQAKGLAKARQILVRTNLAPDERKTYDYLLDIRNSDLKAITYSKAEGREEGREEGRAEGRAEGREEGKIEREKLAKELEKLTLAHESLLAEIAQLKQNQQK